MYSRSAKGGGKGDPNRNPWLAKMRCAGHSMTDVIRLLENAVEATGIVQRFVLLLVKHVL